MNLIYAHIQSQHTSVGASTVGTLSHVASMIWSLANTKHNNNEPKKDRISHLLVDAAEGDYTYAHD